MRVNRVDETIPPIMGTAMRGMTSLPVQVLHITMSDGMPPIARWGPDRVV